MQADHSRFPARGAVLHRQGLAGRAQNGAGHAGVHAPAGEQYREEPGPRGRRHGRTPVDQKESKRLLLQEHGQLLLHLSPQLSVMRLTPPHIWRPDN